jgi:putative endonuclease
VNPAKGRHSKESVPEIHKTTEDSGWFVYMVRCKDSSLYTGITTDIERRIIEHNTCNRLAAAYTRSRRPVVLVYKESYSDRSSALKREYEIKQLSSNDKLFLINNIMTVNASEK